jgi:Cu-Zn family superoxide dismutase
MRAIYSISAALLLSACGREEPAATTPSLPQPEPTLPTPNVSPPINVQLQPTSGNKASGSVTVSASGPNVTFSGTVSGLTPGSVHGIHIHEKGDCSAPDASSAGEHFNPLGKPHGALDANSHAGDLGNITADSQGNAPVNITKAHATLSGGASTDVAGKAIIVHAKADDLTSQPSGESGDRIACGVIG